MRFPRSIQNLIEEFTKLPTVGPKTAERFVFYLLNKQPEELQRMAQAIAELKEKTTICKTCLSISETNPCSICSNQTRDRKTICIVSDSRDMLLLEATKQYNGLYFILGGLIDTINGIKPEHLNFKFLSSSIKSLGISEMILALNPTLEGEITSMYIAKLYKAQNIKITRLARGLSSGSNLEYADEVTLSNALKYRNEL